MHIGGIATIYSLRTTPAAAGASSAVAQDAAQSPQNQALTMLKSVTETETDAIKARARERLEDAKKQLEFLRRWNFDPEILARQAGHLAREVGDAAKDFASAVTAGSSTESAANGATTAAMLAGQSDAETTGTTESGEDDLSFAQKAYQDTMKDGTGQKTVSAGDRKTLEEFKAVAQQIKALLEEAIRRMREQKNADQYAIAEAQKSGHSLNQAIQGLNGALGGGAPLAAAGMTVTIPTSITI
jgi:hypothetical protein